MTENYLVGINPVEGALSHDPANVLEILVEKGADNPRVRELADNARQQGIAVSTRGRADLDRLADGARHQGIVARYKRQAARTEDDLDELLAAAGANALLLILDGVTDPHNLGACLRSAEASGVTAVVIPKDKAASITPVVQRASAGAADRVPLIRVTNLARAMEEIKKAGVWITGLAGEGDRSLYEIDFKGPAAVALGSEGEGLRRLTRERCDFLARIPMRGQVESLNVSVATGVVLFEALRQRGAKK
jgi:23S rRNA (guanosine2251-2'-O)-methyltransferase